MFVIKCLPRSTVGYETEDLDVEDIGLCAEERFPVIIVASLEDLEKVTGICASEVDILVDAES